MLFLAAAVLGARLYGDKRSEQAFATGLLFVLGIALPIHVLGWSSKLTAYNVAWTTLALACGALIAALWAVPAPHCFLGHAVLRCVRLPFDAVAIAFRARSIVALGLIGTMGVIVWSAVLAYLAPASGWDGLWYHDSMVGFSIQNRGFTLEKSLPPWHSMIDGYTRGSEYFNLFPALLWDRRLLELAPSVFAAIALPGIDALLARFGLGVILRLGISCAYVLIPGFCLQLRSTYIDVQVLVVYLAALYFVTQPVLRLRDALMATLSMALLCNAKSSGLVLTVVMFGVFYLRILLRFGRKAPAQAALGLVTAFVAIGFFGGLTYLRNYLLHKNPMYPLVVESPRLHIQWQGPAPVHFWDDFDGLKEDERRDLIGYLQSPRQVPAAK